MLRKIKKESKVCKSFHIEKAVEFTTAFQVLLYERTQSSRRRGSDLRSQISERDVVIEKQSND